MSRFFWDFFKRSVCAVPYPGIRDMCREITKKSPKKDHPIFLPRSSGARSVQKWACAHAVYAQTKKNPQFFFIFAVGVPLKKPPRRKVFSSKIPLPSPELIKKERRANQHRCCCLGDSRTGAELLCPPLSWKTRVKRGMLWRNSAYTHGLPIFQ